MSNSHILVDFLVLNDISWRQAIFLYSFMVSLYSFETAYSVKIIVAFAIWSPVSFCDISLYPWW